MLLGTHRVAETTSKDCNRLYLRKPIKRSTPPSQEELLARRKFAAVAQAVAERRADLSKVTADQEAFKAQKEDGYKTMRSYLWSLESKAYDEENA